jgi:hypothetical protein
MRLKSLLRQVKASGKIWTHHIFSWINAIIQNEFILWKTTRYFKIKTGLRVESRKKENGFATTKGVRQGCPVSLLLGKYVRKKNLEDENDGVEKISGPGKEGK